MRQAVQEMAADAWERRKSPGDLLDLRFIRNARRMWGSFAMADTTGRELTYGKTLIAAILVSEWLRKKLVDNPPRAGNPPHCVGVMLPATVGGALVNVGITLAGAVPVNLNFTAGTDAMAAAVRQCGIRVIISSTTFLAKAKLEPMEGMVFLEDILAGVTKAAKLRALVKARFAPAARISAGGRTPDSLAAIIFSSGSTGIPKGVMLSHYNVIANIEAMAQAFWIGKRDRVTGILPFFHSFGFTVGIWFPLISGCGVAFHPNPSEARVIGELVAKYRTTLLIGTPTFCLIYARKCTREELASLRFVIVGAEKLRAAAASVFRDEIGMELLEGYGCTEMAPVVAVNGPDYRVRGAVQPGNKYGTVGQPLPGIAAKIVDPVTLDPLGPGQEGLLLVRGPNCMMGYLNDPRQTAEVFADGWYITGDVALIDDEGCIRITDRLSRFSKIGGEMAPHIRIEEAIAELIGDCPCVVTAVPDDRRGERLAVLYSCPEVSPVELWQRLSETDIPRLWLPKRENFYQVDDLPRLGSGKLDLHGVRRRAQELAEAAAMPRVR